MDKFPQMLFRCPGPEFFHGAHFATTVVDNASGLEEQLADGWHETTDAAKAAYEKTNPTSTGQPKPDDTAPPTRAELEQKAKELDIDFSPNIGDKKLAERIAEKLKA